MGEGSACPPAAAYKNEEQQQEGGNKFKNAYLLSTREASDGRANPRFFGFLLETFFLRRYPTWRLATMLAREPPMVKPGMPVMAAAVILRIRLCVSCSALRSGGGAMGGVA